MGTTKYSQVPLLSSAKWKLLVFYLKLRSEKLARQFSCFLYFVCNVCFCTSGLKHLCCWFRIRSRVRCILIIAKNNYMLQLIYFCAYIVFLLNIKLLLKRCAFHFSVNFGKKSFFKKTFLLYFLTKFFVYMHMRACAVCARTWSVCVHVEFVRRWTVKHKTTKQKTLLFFSNSHCLQHTF